MDTQANTTAALAPQSWPGLYTQLKVKRSFDERLYNNNINGGFYLQDGAMDGWMEWMERENRPGECDELWLNKISSHVTYLIVM